MEILQRVERRCQQEHVRMMPTETLRPIGEITASCGFETATHLGVLFRRAYDAP